jgi:Ser/Thr protein kinase RdoA (MazF antagonist)
MPESLEPIARDVLASSYGIPRVTISPIGYGLINWLARVDAGHQSYVLKRYNPAYFRPDLIELSVAAQHHCYVHGVPVPAPVPNRMGELITGAPDASYVLFEYVEGRHLQPGRYSATAAHSLGEAVGRVVLALATDWRELREPWTLRKPDETVSQFERLLAAAEAGTTDLDRRTAQDVRFRLAYLHRHPDVYAQISVMPMQWIHCDFLETNVLFASNGQVSAVVDFDNTTVLPRGFDFMRALAYCVTPLVPERDHYLRGYLEMAQPSRVELATYAPLWMYTAVCDIWPLEIRYLEPERFDPRWEDACGTSFLSDGWETEMEMVAAWLVKG